MNRALAVDARRGIPQCDTVSLFVTLSLVSFGACAARGTVREAKGAPTESAADRAAFESPLELIESAPIESTLDHADLRDAKDVWPQMFARAQKRIDVEQFYLANEAGQSLEPSILALEAAAARGVKVRVLADAKMGATYPETLSRLAARANVTVQQIDYRHLAGGVQHAKFFVVDAGSESAEAYEGSQNFDWRSLSHIQEIGLRFRAPAAVRALEDVFETDWALATGTDRSARAASTPTDRFPTPAGTDDGARLTLVASPKGYLPDETHWDLPAIVALIDGAKESVRVQVLTYRAHGRGDFPELEDALKRAASRGVSVSLLVSHWSLRKGTIEGLQALAKWRPEAQPAAAESRATALGKDGSVPAAGTLKPIDVRIFTVPELASGYLPFARVAHAKYLVVDGASAWVGTNNWEKDYFTKTRNVGLIVEGGTVPARLAKFFEQNWSGPYAAPLDPDKTYPQPHTGE